MDKRDHQDRREALNDLLATRFAQLLRDRHGAELYLFGSRARGTQRPDSDYDFAAVAPSFAAYRRIHRALDRFALWHEAGGRGIGLDLHCYTPEEFALELDSVGYLGEANERGELLRIPVRVKDAA